MDTLWPNPEMRLSSFVCCATSWPVFHLRCVHNLKSMNLLFGLEFISPLTNSLPTFVFQRLMKGVPLAQPDIEQILRNFVKSVMIILRCMNGCIFCLCSHCRCFSIGFMLDYTSNISSKRVVCFSWFWIKSVVFVDFFLWYLVSPCICNKFVSFFASYSPLKAGLVDTVGFVSFAPDVNQGSSKTPYFCVLGNSGFPCFR